MYKNYSEIQVIVQNHSPEDSVLLSRYKSIADLLIIISNKAYSGEGS